MLANRVLLVGTGEERAYGVRTLLRNVSQLVILDSCRSRSDFRWGDEALIVDLDDQAACAEKVYRAHKARPFDAVLTFSEHLVQLQANISQGLGLPGPSPEAAARARQKDLMRSCFHQRGVPCPLSVCVNSLSAARAAAKNMGFPLVIKPPDYAASLGVVRVNDEADLESAYLYASQWSRAGDMLVEQFVAGPEFSVDCYTANGMTKVMAVTDRHNDEGPFFAEHGHTVPSLVPADRREKLEQVAIEGIRALGLDYCMSHCEIKLSPTGPKVIEIGARLGGGLLVDSLEVAYGINAYEMALQVALGQNTVLQPTRNRACTVRYLTANPGTITRISGHLDALRSVPEVLDLCLPRRGHVVGPLRSNREFVGHVMVAGDNPSESSRRAQEFASSVTFESV